MSFRGFRAYNDAYKIPKTRILFESLPDHTKDVYMYPAIVFVTRYNGWFPAKMNLLDTEVPGTKDAIFSITDSTYRFREYGVVIHGEWDASVAAVDKHWFAMYNGLEFSFDTGISISELAIDNAKSRPTTPI